MSSLRNCGGGRCMAAVHVEQTVERLFRVLGTLMPGVLIALRDGPHDRAAIEQWARTYWLNSPVVIHSDARGQKEWRHAMLCAETCPSPT
jgi:hypothetical protein